jgi:geranylgeranyl reductase family protein
MRASYDVVIIGAGPAGCSAAEALARRGFDVAVLEEHAVVGEPVDCTGVLSAEAFERFDLPRQIVCGEIKGITLHSPAGIPITHNETQPLAFVVDRTELDRTLAVRAEAAGATLHLSTRAVGVTRRGDGVTITCRNGGGETRDFSAQILLLAGGPQFVFHERLGLGVPQVLWQSAHAELAGDGLPHPQVYLGRDVAPGAFAWAVPVRRAGGPRVRVGVNSRTDAPGYLRRLCTARLAHLAPSPESLAPRSWVVPIVPSARTFGERVLALGDAAGQVKSTSGGGIYFGMLSARIAAEVAAEAFGRRRFDSATLATYETRWRASLGLEVKLGSLFRRLFSRMADRDVDQLFRELQREIATGKLSEKVSFDWHTHLIVFLLRHPGIVRLFLRSFWDEPVVRNNPITKG